jgi:alkanesulfonate monooxygenase SsuD/methylene tetrahydromethanopterin reductase-like flavin-dependent oxidoreductase (luciferase family)
VTVRISFKTSPQGVDWPTLEGAWQAASALAVFDGGWLNDHLTDPRLERGGASFEAIAALSLLAHHLPGRWVGHVVLANTFRHPAVLAKAASTLDHATGGRFILGLGAGWHVHEHVDFGLELPPIGERISRLGSAARVIRALATPEAASPTGVTLADPFYPLVGATGLPAPLTPGGPPLWLGGQGPRGLDLAARYADGWFVPALPFVDVELFGTRRDDLAGRLEAAGRDPGSFAFAAQIPSGADPATLETARELALGYARAGATDLILASPADLGAAGLRRLASEVAEPLRDALG